jgi:hypothetical protein
MSIFNILKFLSIGVFEEDKTSDIIMSTSLHLFAFIFLSLDPIIMSPERNKLGSGTPYRCTVVARDGARREVKPHDQTAGLWLLLTSASR